MGPSLPPLIAIACGGTGGHLFPGLAVAGEIEALGAHTRVFVSEKEVDQAGLRQVPADRVVRMPAAGWEPGRPWVFAGSLLASWRVARSAFREMRPSAVLAMGGFTSVAPVLAARWLGAPIFLHEANSVAGRANRCLSWLARECFLSFPSAATGLRQHRARVTGMPVRAQFQKQPAAGCRERLGLAPDRPTLLIMGGSQGAAGLNEAFLSALPSLVAREPRLQFLHLTGPISYERTAAAYANLGCTARVWSFVDEMEVVLGAADLAVSRAGGSSLAELAALRVPAILIPYPHAADNHQHHNARAFAEAGAARWVAQSDAAPERLRSEILGLLLNPGARASMANALTRLHQPQAARTVARHILGAVTGRNGRNGGRPRNHAPERQPSPPLTVP